MNPFKICTDCKQVIDAFATHSCVDESKFPREIPLMTDAFATLIPTRRPVFKTHSKFSHVMNAANVKVFHRSGVGFVLCFSVAVYRRDTTKWVRIIFLEEGTPIDEAKINLKQANNDWDNRLVRAWSE